MKIKQREIRRSALPLTVAILALVGSTTFTLMDNDGKTTTAPERSRTTLLKGQTAFDPWIPTTVPPTIYEAPTDSRPEAVPPTRVQQMPGGLERTTDPIERLFDDEFSKCMEINDGYALKDFTPPPTTFVPEDGWSLEDYEQMSPPTTYPEAFTDIHRLCRTYATYRVAGSENGFPEAPAATPIPTEGRVTG